jgi:D-alanyl-D-alanine dipeptidase
MSGRSHARRRFSPYMMALVLLPHVGQAGAQALVDATHPVPDLIVDLRYARADNFLNQAVYPAGAKCLLLPEAAEHLTQAARALRVR